MPLDTSEFMGQGNWFTMPLIARLKPGVESAAWSSSNSTRNSEGLVATAWRERFRRRYLGARRESVSAASRNHGPARAVLHGHSACSWSGSELLLLIACDECRRLSQSRAMRRGRTSWA